MSLDAAKAFILRYGRCVRCSRRLKAAQSVERGIGPVCMAYFSFRPSAVASPPAEAPVPTDDRIERLNQLVALTERHVGCQSGACVEGDVFGCPATIVRPAVNAA